MRELIWKKEKKLMMFSIHCDLPAHIGPNQFCLWAFDKFCQCNIRGNIDRAARRNASVRTIFSSISIFQKWICKQVSVFIKYEMTPWCQQKEERRGAVKKKMKKKETRSSRLNSKGNVLSPDPITKTADNYSEFTKLIENGASYRISEIRTLSKKFRATV